MDTIVTCLFVFLKLILLMNSKIRKDLAFAKFLDVGKSLSHCLRSKIGSSQASNPILFSKGIDLMYNDGFI